MCTETLELHGHIVDNQALPRVLDLIIALGAEYRIDTITIGHKRTDPSRALITVTAPNQATLDTVVERVTREGATLVESGGAMLQRAPRDGVLPDDFYASTNLLTHVLLKNRWITVGNAEMDCAIVVAPDQRAAKCVRMHRVKKGAWIVAGHKGIRVEAPERASGAKEAFGFMASAVSSEKPKHLIIREIAREMVAVRKRREKILFVGGPAIIHTGAGPQLERLIRLGMLDVLFAGNALAAHDIESSIFGTSLGVSLSSGSPVEHGHEHHLRAINRVRGAGSIAAAVKQKKIPSGVMRACVQKRVPYVLSGSIRDDGPLPDVIIDMQAAQDAMRAHLPGVGLALMVGTTLLSIATGNMLPAAVKTICVDINPAVVTKLADRGTFQAVGLVTDAESFLRQLVAEVEKHNA